MIRYSEVCSFNSSNCFPFTSTLYKKTVCLKNNKGYMKAVPLKAFAIKGMQNRIKGLELVQ